MAALLKFVLSLVIMDSIWHSTKIASQVQANDLVDTTTKKGPKQLPHGANWASIRSNDMLYIDKTGYLKTLLMNETNFWVVHRPRRFGKTLFVNMIRSFFSGEQTKFQNLEIGMESNTKFFADKRWMQHEKEWIQFPVILLDFGQITFTTADELFKFYQLKLRHIARSYSIDETLIGGISDLIETLQSKFELPVVILVDEYDTPILRAQRSDGSIDCKRVIFILNSIFSEIKCMELKIGFAFVTGISKLSLQEFQSGASIFEDVTYEHILSTAFGLTEKEIHHRMEPYITELAQQIYPENENGIDKVKTQLRLWYNGYRFDIKNASLDVQLVYNPISVIRSFSEKKFSSYWCRTYSDSDFKKRFYEDTLQWNINDFRQNSRYTIPKWEIENLEFPRYPDIHLPLWLFVYGYLTVFEYNSKTEEFIVAYANHEIEIYVSIVVASYKPSSNEVNTDNDRLKRAMSSGNIKESIHVIREMSYSKFERNKADIIRQGEINQRLSCLFYHAGIVHLTNIVFKKPKNSEQDGGDIDFLTIEMKNNFVISIKCGMGASAIGAIDQLIKYTQKNPSTFWPTLSDKINIEGLIYFLGLSFSYDDGVRLEEWILIPCRNSDVKLEEIESSSDSITNEFRSRIASYREELKEERTTSISSTHTELTTRTTTTGSGKVELPSPPTSHSKDTSWEIWNAQLKSLKKEHIRQPKYRH